MNGTVLGESLNVRTAIMDTGFAPGVLSLHLMDVPSERACELRSQLANPREPQNEGPELIFHVFVPADGSAPMEYPAVSNQAYQAEQQQSGQVWGKFWSQKTGDRYMTSGTLTLDEFEPGPEGVARGSFLVKFGKDALMGTFDASPCSAQ